MSLKNNKLLSMLLALKGTEKRRFALFLDSPYFNQREDLKLLLQFFLSQKEGVENWSYLAIWQAVYPNEVFKMSKLRLIISYLTKLLERFLVVEKVLDDELGVKMMLAKNWRERSVEHLHLGALQDAEKVLAKDPHRNWAYLMNRYEWQSERYRRSYTTEPEKASEAQLVSVHFDAAFIAMKLRQNCLLLVHDLVYQWGYEAGQFDKWLLALSVEELPQEPAILLYWYCNQMLLHPNEEQYFRQFKKLLLQHGPLFPAEEARDLQLQAVNYGIRQVNKGNRAYFHDIVDLYKAGLEQRYILDGKQLSRFTYHNIVTAALQVGEIDWAQSFIDEWTNSIERRYRERMYNFSKAKIAYADKRYSEALPLLQQANYHDPLLNLGARALTLKIYYELQEWDALNSHLDAFTSYLRRNPNLGYHKTNYRNMIKFTKKLLKFLPQHSAGREKIRSSILAENNLTEKAWLLHQLD